MPAVPTRVNYKSEISHDKAETLPSVARPADFAEVEALLLRLARAVRMFHTYPATSQLCADAIAAAHKALVAIDRRERLLLRVTPTELILDETCFGPEQSWSSSSSAACIGAYRRPRSQPERVAAPPLALLRIAEPVQHVHQEHVHARRAAVRARRRHHHSADGAPAGNTRRRFADGRDPRSGRARTTTASADAGAGGPVDYLYPPDKGWVRLDRARTSTRLAVDLAVLVDNPVDLAGIFA
jgi:hypothetical protein